MHHQPTGPLFHIVLHEPEIPNNTGNIGRTCVATGCALHLIHPLGFDTSEKACRRAGLDYWPRLDVRHHDDWAAYERDGSPAPDRMWLLSTKAQRLVFDAAIRPGDHFVFGKETAGLPPGLLDRYRERMVALPMAAGERSLNLATAVCAVVYEGVRRGLAEGWVGVDANGKLTDRVNTRFGAGN
ncbi:MAG: tRNA (cytidine(34)-2'-O)-methyltransferase [Phycisphaerales bacterium]|nr:tRNA (cytidine(34)-2'-O)-methyltransferase [Phycisphaerales bacterium]